MSKIPNLWPEQIKLDVLSPITILRAQAEMLGKLTRGVLQGVVETEEASCIQLRLVVVAPAYRNYRHTLLTILHTSGLPYPAEVQAPSLDNNRYGNALIEALGQPRYPQAASDGELISLIGKVLQSPESRSILFSLIAESNERRAPVESVDSEDVDSLQPV